MLLRKVVYPHQYTDDWETFNQTTLPEKQEFYSNLNMKEITGADHIHGKRVRKDFELKGLGKYHDLYLKSDTLLLTVVFENLRKLCLQIYQLGPAKFLSALGLAWQAATATTKKKRQVQLKLLTDIDMLLIIEKGIRGGICNTIHQYAKANDKYMKYYDKSKESSYLKY